MYKASTTTNCLTWVYTLSILSTRRSRQYQYGTRIKSIQSSVSNLTIPIDFYNSVKRSNATIEIDNRKMFARWPDRFEKLQISIPFYYLRGKGRTDLLFCLKKLALFWLSLKENNRAKRKLESRRTTQALRGAKARRESFSLRNGRINPILVLQSSVYRAPLEGIETFAKKISARHLFAFSESIQRARLPVFPLRFDPASKLEFGINLGLKFNSIRRGEGIIYRRDRIALRYKSRGGTRADVTISNVPWKAWDRWCNYVKRAHRGSLGQLRLRVL